MVSQADGYLTGIRLDEAGKLTAVDRPGLEALHSNLKMGEAMAFLCRSPTPGPVSARMGA